MHPSLENITSIQRSILNRIALIGAQIAVEEADPESDRSKAMELGLKELRENLLVDLEIAEISQIEVLCELWWKDEIAAITDLRQSDEIGIEEALLYRIIMGFSRIHCLSPFVYETKNFLGRKKQVFDNNEYQVAISKIFVKFANASLVSRSRQSINELPDAFFVQLARINIDQSIYSARYHLLSTDKSIAKGLLVGGVAGVTTSLVLGPVIGTMVGEAAGLSGAAAKSYGLALLGGGSIASGGLGMAGGSAVLGVLFGGRGAANGAINSGQIDEESLSQALRFLPLLLSSGRILREMGCTRIAEALAKFIAGKHQELEGREIELSMDKESNGELLKKLKATSSNYGRAVAMAKGYDWSSGYDFFRRIVS